MRTVGIILMMIGALVGGTGGYGLAEYVRPGDWVRGPTAVANPNGEHVVVTQYGLLSYDSEIRLTAGSASGVFLGTANPIDVDDYTSGVARATITSLSFQRIDVTTTSTDTKDPAADPVGLDLWLDLASGTAPVLVVHQASAPPAQVVLITKSSDFVTLSVEFQVPGIRSFVFAIIGAGAALALIGVALLIVGIIRARRRNTRKTSAPPPTAPPVAPSDQPPYGPPVPTPWAQGRLSRWVTGLVAVTLIATTSGCTVPAVPRMPLAGDAPSRAEVTKVPLTSDHTGEVGGNIADRDSAANVDGYAPRYSTETWAGLYTDVPLQWRVFDSTYAKAEGSTDRAALSCSARIKTVYGSVAKAYPMAATALVRWTCSGYQPWEAFTVLTRAHSYTPWFIAAESRLVVTAPTSGNVPPTAAEDEAASQAVTALLDYVRGGSPGRVKPSPDLANFHAKATTATDYAITAVSTTIVDNADKQGTFRTAKTSTGTLVTASYVVTVTEIALPGYRIWWPAPLDQVLGQPGRRSNLTRKYGVIATVLLEGDSATIVGFDVGAIL